MTIRETHARKVAKRLRRKEVETLRDRWLASASADGELLVRDTASALGVDGMTLAAAANAESGDATEVLYGDGTFATVGGTVLAIATVTTGTALTSAHRVVLVDATSGPLTMTLPAVASSTRRQFNIKKIDVSANAVTVDGDGSETIDGATTATLAAQYDSVTVVCDGAAWYILS